MLWENDRLQSIYKSAQQTEMCREITSPQIAAYFFWSFPFGMARTIWFPIRNFRFFRINDLCVVFLPFVLFVYHILSMLPLLLLFFFFYNWWSVCNFTEYVRRLDEILAQKIEKFTQLRGKTALLTFFSSSLLAYCCVKHRALCSLDLKGEFFHLWTKTYFRSSLLSTWVRYARRLGIVLIG